MKGSRDELVNASLKAALCHSRSLAALLHPAFGAEDESKFLLAPLSSFKRGSEDAPSASAAGNAVWSRSADN